ncbi:two-component response regulator [Citrobacter amalonaticus]|nr:two-component response regulator [Citrobacter amalonaticus]
MQQVSVWLVEDEQGIADTLIYMLQQEGFSVEAFERGLPALEKARHQCPGCSDSRCRVAGYQRF